MPDRSRTHVVLLVGLPGVGKSRLAAALAPHLDAVILNRDRIRDAIIPERYLDYGDAQNAIATDTMLAVLGHLLASAKPPTIILDGKPFSRASEVDTVREFVCRGGGVLFIIHCVADPVVIERRLELDLANNPRNVLAERTPQKAARIRAAFEPLTGEHITIDTAGDVQDAVARCLSAVKRWGT